MIDVLTSALQLTVGQTLRLVGVMFAIVSGAASTAYIFGKYTQRGDSRADVVESNEDELSNISDSINHLETAIGGLNGTVIRMQETMERNRKDIQYQHRLMHDQLLGDGEDCGNPKCPYCHPENFEHEVDVETPIPENVAEQFNGWDTDNADD